jgi:hypothetical protein
MTKDYRGDSVAAAGKWLISQNALLLQNELLARRGEMKNCIGLFTGISGE